MATIAHYNQLDVTTKKNYCERYLLKNDESEIPSKVAGLSFRPAALLKNSLCTWCFPANFAKF